MADEEHEGDYKPPVYPDTAAGSLMRQRDALQNGVDGDRAAAATLLERASAGQAQVDQLTAAIDALST